MAFTGCLMILHYSDEDIIFVLSLTYEQVVHCVPQKTVTFLFFYNNSIKRGPISIIFGTWSPEERYTRTF